jgi:hypothetical protein
MANPDTIIISGTSFDVYGPRADADAYFQGSVDRSVWAAAAGTDKDRALVASSRYLDGLFWEGVVTDLVTPQPLAWPRTGVIDKNGVTVGSTAFPNDLLYGYYELAQQFLANTTLAASSGESFNIRRVVADVVEVEFFRPTSGSALPTVVDYYLAQFQDRQITSIGGSEFGTDQESSFIDSPGQLNDAYK